MMFRRRPRSLDERELRLWKVGRALTLAFAAAVMVASSVFYGLYKLLHVQGIGATTKLDAKTLFDLVKLSFGVVAGSGALVALVVAYRRQRVDEAGAHREATKLHAERFSQAVDKLGSDSPAVRLGGVHALAGLADDAPTQDLRQTCIDVLCGYLQLPFPPDPGNDPADQEEHHRYLALRKVRHTILRLVGDHYRRPWGTHRSWQGSDLDLRGVTIDGSMDFRRAVFAGGRVSFDGAVFSGGTVSFDRAKFGAGRVSFDDAVFSGGELCFNDAEFAFGTVTFKHAEFGHGRVSFDDAVFSGGELCFNDAVFSGGAVTFTSAKFSESLATFYNAVFSGGMVSFEGAVFSGDRVVFSGGRVFFDGAEFSGGQVFFSSAQFDGGMVLFGNAVFSGGRVSFDGARFCGGLVSLSSAEFSGGTVSFDRALFFDDTVSFDRAEFSGGTVSFDRALFSGGTASFDGAVLSGGRLSFMDATGPAPLGLLITIGTPVPTGVCLPPTWLPVP